MLNALKFNNMPRGNVTIYFMRTQSLRKTQLISITSTQKYRLQAFHKGTHSKCLITAVVMCYGTYVSYTPSSSLTLTFRTRPPPH